MICGAVAVLVVAGCASPAKSPSPAPTTAASRACSAQPPGCGSGQGTLASLAGFTWSAAPAPPLSPRSGQASVWTGTGLLIWGGVNGRGQEADDGAAYDPVTRAWTPMPASPLSPRDGAFAVWTGSRALFWGGGTGNLSLLMNGASYDPASRTWTMLPAAPLPAGIDGLQAIVWTGTQMVVIQPGAGAAFDPATRSWATVPALPGVIGWQPYAIGAEWAGREVIAWVASRPPAVNGITASGYRFSAYSWLPGDRAWTSLPGELPGTPQGQQDDGFPFGTAAAIGGRLLFLGGTSCPPGVSCPAQDFFDGAWFGPSSGTWTFLPETFSGGSGPAVWTGSAMVVFATTAGASPGPPAGAAAAFAPPTGGWTDLARCPVPDLTNASLAWTGRQLIVVTMDDESGDSPQTEVLSSPDRDSK